MQPAILSLVVHIGGRLSLICFPRQPGNRTWCKFCLGKGELDRRCIFFANECDGDFSVTSPDIEDNAWESAEALSRKFSDFEVDASALFLSKDLWSQASENS